MAYRCPAARAGAGHRYAPDAHADAIGDALMAQAASDVTRGEDALLVADRLSAVSEVVAAAGVNDINQGVDLLVHSDDIAVQSVLVASLRADDLAAAGVDLMADGIVEAAAAAELGDVASEMARKALRAWLLPVRNSAQQRRFLVLPMHLKKRLTRNRPPILFDH